MATNPFLVKPAEYGPSMAGLGQSLAAYGQQREQKELRDAQQLKMQEAEMEAQEAIGAMEQAYADKDYDAIAKMSIRYPQMGAAVMKAIGANEQRDQDNIVNTGFQLLSSPDNYEQIINENPLFAEKLGGAESLIDSFANNRDQTLDQAEYFLAHTAGDRFAKWRENTKAPEGPKTGTFIYKDTPDGFLKVNTSTGTEEEIKVGSKAFKAAEDKKIKQIDKDMKAEGKNFDQSKKIRDRYDTQSKEFVKVQDAYDRIEASVEDPDAAGDIALIFNYMKMLDPGSVVREGEFATAQNAGGVDDSVLNMYNKLIDGERLQPNQRKMFAGRASKLFDKAKGRNKSVRAENLRIAKRYGLSEADIFGDPESTPAAKVETKTEQTVDLNQMSDEDLAKSLGL